MAFMCTDSGNLMAIAQQVIAQQQQQQHHQDQFQQIQSSISSATWAPQAEPPQFFADPFSFPPPPSFKLSDEFDSDEWMDSLIGSGDLSPLFPDQSCSTDLDRVIMPRGDVSAVDLPPPPLKPDKDVKISCSSPQSLYTSSSPSHPILKTLLDCARFCRSNQDLAIRTLAQLKPLVSDLGDPIQRVGFYFAEALSLRLCSTPSPIPNFSLSEFTLCYQTLNEACPYSKFAHLTANQAILEATESASLIHIVDFGLVQGIQWAALLQALATRDVGKPTRIRISGIPSHLLGFDSLTATGKRLSEFAEMLEVNFEFIPVLTPICALTSLDFRIEEGEFVAVNFMLELYRLLSGSTERAQSVLRVVKSLEPEVVTLGEYEVTLTGISFVNRFSNALFHYSSWFESIEPALSRDSRDRAELERVLFGNKILRAVGPEKGSDRLDVMFNSTEWTCLMESSGFKPVRFSNYAISQAKLLLWNYDYSAKYSLLDSSPGFLSLAWNERKLLTVSSWR